MTPARGPAVVALGGGHGLSASLRAIRRYAGSVVAVVSVADDGGSSGRLRQAIPDLPAPGDIRRCLASLADEASPLGRALEHRFDTGDLEGHAFGNLLLAALAEELGSFGAAVDEVARQVGSVGRVLPATLGPVSLEGLRRVPVPAGALGTQRVFGQVAVQSASGITDLRLHPELPESSPEVAASILAADQVVLGPGSLFTSVLAAAIVPAVRQALQATSAQRVYVANLHAEVPETEGFGAADEVSSLLDHDIPLDLVVCDPSRPCGPGPGRVPCIEAPVGDDRGLVHHPERLGAVLAGIASCS
ncbi:MAG: hypothetical protein JWM89_3993 [Acidimicrobiales bacterium]|nr:hypothetical protein [Acidimicrobiales bacterium]